MEEIGEGVKSNYVDLVLPERATGKIHSLFRSSLNLTLNGELIHIGKEEAGLSAWGIVVPDAAIKGLLGTLRVGGLVYWRAGDLLIYGQRNVWHVHLQRFQVEDCRIPSAGGFNPQHLHFLLERLASYRLPSRTGLEMDEQTTSLLQRFLEVDWEDESFFRKFHHYFIGRGLGLTPSGDDFLMGILIMTTAFESAHTWRKLLSDEYTGFSTTEVSKAYYRALLKGYTSSPFLSLLRAVRDGQKREVDVEIEKIGRYGHTSGWDTLLGIYYWLLKFLNPLNAE